MVSRDSLNRYLNELYRFADFDDYCQNGLQVEGRRDIRRIVFAVSFNQPVIDEAVNRRADALIVHHGIFSAGHFVLTGILKERVQKLLDHGISLFGIHLPMDTHPDLGNSARLINSIGGRIGDALGYGYLADNEKKSSLNEILEKLNRFLRPGAVAPTVAESVTADSHFSITVRNGFVCIPYGPEVPERMAVLSGGGAGMYEASIGLAVDTFICGDFKEPVPSISLESATNFVSLGHYLSEKPGIMALMEHLVGNFKIEASFIDVANPL